jgi:hypothetical protein
MGFCRRPHLPIMLAYNTVWEVDLDGAMGWIVIGFERKIKTVIWAKRFKEGLGQAIVLGRPLFEFLANVNRTLMEEEVWLLDDEAESRPRTNPGSGRHLTPYRRDSGQPTVNQNCR